MKFGVLKIFAIFGLVSEWFGRAIEDGKIDQDEILELVTKILALAEVKAEIDLSSHL